MRSPVFPPDPQEPRQTNTGRYILIGCAGCGCFAGVAVILWVLVVAMMFSFHADEIEREMERRAAQLMASAGSYAVGSEFILYGKTLDNEDLDWESLRGKYVLVKFTATWCPPCTAAIPGMLEAYEQYRDKGFEIVSIYIGERGADPVATVRRFVEREELPWIILSEFLTAEAGQPPQGEAFGIRVVPTMVLVDREGKVIAIVENYREELRRVFGE